MTDVFISYVREDERFVDFLAQILRLNGVSVWLDKEKLTPGLRWKEAIRQAIRTGTFFISVHSRNRAQRETSYVNEEAVIAVEEIRKRPYNRTWFIPIKIDDCEIEERPIGGGEALSDIQWCDLTKWSTGMLSLLKALGVQNPVIDHGKPLAPGLPSSVSIVNGFVRYDDIPSLPIFMQGLEFRVAGGWCQRQDDNSILAYIETVAPVRVLQEFNEVTGLTGFYAVAFGEQISSEPTNPTEFSFEREYALPPNTNVFDFASNQTVSVPFTLPLRTAFSAIGVINGYDFSGVFSGEVTSLLPQLPMHDRQSGQFQLRFAPFAAQ